MSEPDTIARLNASLEGRYRIDRPLGRGGMATVYLADDLKHARKVALKALQPELAALVGADRFLGEIRTTAALQHPHILPLHDSGTAEEFLYYVMPYVEGESLRDRLDREHALPVSEAVEIASKVASALDYAHRRGVIHRDVKPANILLHDGEPVVADFGIALALSAGGAGRLTETGLSLGTPHYMSPEQATGDQNVGAATDIYALGCVTYEMLVGSPPHVGSTPQAVLGKIITEPAPSVTAERRTVPANVDAAVRKALEKLPADRFSGADDFGTALRDPGFRYRIGEESAPHGNGEEARRWKRVAAVLAVAFAVAVGTTVWTLFTPGPTTEGAVERFPNPFRSGQFPLGALPAPSYALSRDGELLVYRPRTYERGGLLARSWDELDARVIPGSEGALYPAISPDGQEFVFQRAGAWWIQAIAGGAARHLVSVDQVPAAYWGRDDFIYLTTDSGATRIPAAGGYLQMVTKTEAGQRLDIVSDVLPDGATALVSSVSLGADVGVELRAVGLDDGKSSVIGRGFGARYTPTGHLVYFDGETVWGAPFDPVTLELGGPPVALLENIAGYRLSDMGDLFYQVRGRGVTERREFVWVSRTGDVTVVDRDWSHDMAPGVIQGFSLSPDGGRLAYRDVRDGGTSVWIKELDDGPLSRLTFDSPLNRMPRWVDEDRVTFVSVPRGGQDLYIASADGTGGPELLFDHEVDIWEGFFGPAGEWLVFTATGVSGAVGNDDILAVRPDGDGEPLSLLAEKYDEAAPALSPDGRWLAYASDETGGYEVYVRPFPDVDAGRWTVSTDGGGAPLWAHSGQELFYVSPNRELVSVRVESNDGFRVADRSVLFSLPDSIRLGIGYSSQYDITPDDRRFIMAQMVETAESAEQSATEWVLVRNWFEELKARVPN